MVEMQKVMQSLKMVFALRDKKKYLRNHSTGHNEVRDAIDFLRLFSVQTEFHQTHQLLLNICSLFYA